MSARIAVYRIVGNDLPPRHRPGSTLENIAMILRSEPELEGARQVWVVSHILDREAEAAILELLRASGREHLHLPLEPEAIERAARGSAREALQALVPINRVRNQVLKLEGEEQWAIPMDGNCVFDQAGWQRLRERVGEESERAVLAAPMIRLEDNREYLSEERFLRPRFEPQVCVRRGARVKFSEARAYGDYNKVELLRRVFPAHALVKTAFGLAVCGERYEAGWVYRLSSSAAPDALAKDRHALRMAAIARLVAMAKEMAKNKY